MLFDFADQITTPSATHTTKPGRLLAAASVVLPLLTAGRPVTTAALANILTTHCGGTDAQGFWQWKDASEVLEIAQVRFLQKFAPALRPLSPEQLLVMLEKLTQLCPTHTKRSDDSARLQQFSTPFGIGGELILKIPERLRLFLLRYFPQFGIYASYMPVTFLWTQKSLLLIDWIESHSKRSLHNRDQ